MKDTVNAYLFYLFVKKKFLLLNQVLSFCQYKVNSYLAEWLFHNAT